ncbi:MAG: DUF1631 family protein [Azonexus sp.]
MVYSTAPLKNAVPAADDAFHILRDCRALYLKQLGQLLQEAERVPASAVLAFQQTVGEYFDEMASSTRRSGFDVADGLTASRISLVGESDLELEIRLGDFSARLMETTGGDLWRVYLRFVTLLRRPDLSTAENPVGPKGIAIGLMDFCAQLGEDHEKKLARVDQLEDYFSKHLTVLYNTLNDFLAERHVETAQPSIITAPDSTTTASAASPANPAAALQKRLLGPAGETATPHGGPAASLLSQAMLANLLSRLDELEKSGKLAWVAPPTFSNTASQPSLETLIPGLFTDQPKDEPEAPIHALNSGELGIPSGAPEAATIDTLALIFETIFASTALSEAIKSALASLQIPLLKAAMLDAGFFASPHHPARQVVDKIALAGLGLPPDVSANHPVCARIQAIASKIRGEFTNDITVFEQQAKELNLLIAERDSNVAHSAEAYVPLLHQVERQNQAGRRCRQVIEQHLTHGAPAEIAAFLRSYWQQVLQAIWLESGEQSTAWQEHDALINDLLWSIQPKTDMEERKHLAKMLQPMLQRLNAGMAGIKVPEAEQAAFLDTCFALQTAAMRGATGSPPAVPEAPPAKVLSKRPDIRELIVGEQRLKIIDQTSGSNRLRPPPARPGSWLRLSLSEGSEDLPLCGRLCPSSPDSTLLLIANPDWGFALAIHPEILDNLFANNAARICSTDSLFDAAAEKALKQTASL